MSECDAWIERANEYLAGCCACGFLPNEESVLWYRKQIAASFVEENMPFPKTDTELVEKGYVFENRAKCKGPTCGKEIEWWRTPKGKRIPLDPGTMEPHWGTCPDAKQF